jgi:TonB family protein
MTRHFFSLALLLVVGTASAQTFSPASKLGKPKAVAIYAPRPDYPIEARERHLTGSGVALLQIDKKTGYVTSARMEKSMGHPMLDHAALAAFSRWRFKPGTVRQIRIPIRYTIGKQT